MKGLHKIVGGIYRIQLILLLMCVLSINAFPSTDRVQAYVSRSGAIDAAWDGPSSFLLAQHQEDSLRVPGADSKELKDPGVALLYALVPGLVVHGAGHFYAGEKAAGWVLASGEILSLCLIGYAVGVGAGESKSGTTSNGNRELIGVFGGGLFVGTWIYDVIGAPLAVQRENREFLQGRNVRLRFDLDHTSHSVRVQIVKRF
ncbi:MAG: hypothetical protein WBC88_05830 [Candidatus Zixiibacteriota bacterium]